jgi:hypothetical protein
MIEALAQRAQSRRDAAITVPTFVLVIYALNSVFSLHVFVGNPQRFLLVIKGAAGKARQFQEIVDRVLAPQFMDYLRFVGAVFA